MYEIFERLCTEHGVTAYRVCKDTGLSTGSISNWKAGRYQLKTEKLQKIADYFGVPVDYLMGRDVTWEKFKKSDLNPEMTADEVRLLGIFRKLNSSGKSRALESLEDLALLDKYTRKETDASLISNAG